MTIPFKKLLLLLSFSIMIASAQDTENTTDCTQLDACYEKCAEDDEKCMEKCEDQFTCPDENDTPLG